MRYPSLVLFSVGLLQAGCGGGDGGGDLTEPEFGSLRITTATTGESQDDGYTLSLDGAAAAPIAANAEVSHEGLEPGSYSVLLGDVAANCTVTGDNPRTVSVPANDEAVAAFTVACVQQTGSIQVTIATAGPGPATFSLLFDGAGHGSIGANDSRTLSNIAMGEHSVGISELPATCQVQEENPRTVSVAFGAVSNLSFSIACTSPPAETGTLRITTSTTGDEQDADGYEVEIEGTAPQPLGSTGTLTVTGLSPGPRSVHLSGIAGNCLVTGEVTRSVTVVASSTVEVTFTIACAATTGSIRVAVATQGDFPDPDGYTFTIDNQPARMIGPSADVTVDGLAAGSHTVLLGGMAPNCSVAESNPRNVTVSPGATAEVAFSVTCAKTTGSIQITTATTGANPDADGYTYSVDGGAAQPIAVNGTVTVANLDVGSHTVTLASIAANCTVNGNPRTVSIVAGETTPVPFDVSCSVPAPPIAFISNGPGLLSVFVVNPDGTGLREFTEGTTPVWSPDGRKMLFSDNDDLYVINADGTGRTALTAGLFGVFQYRWSPDGQMIAFVVERFVGGDFFDDLWVMRSDGSGKRKLANDATQPSWSPNGTRLAYVRASSVRLINLDATGDTRLTNEGVRAFQPAWSPDGARIAFVTIDDKEMFLINPDGSDLVNLTQGQSRDDGPTWSPDGTRILFTTEATGQPSESDIAAVTRDGGSRTILTTLPGFEVGPNWAPDGQRIVFYGSGSGDSEIYVMNADGTGIQNISNRPGTHETQPAWAGGSGSSLRRSEAALDLKWRLLR